MKLVCLLATLLALPTAAQAECVDLFANGAAPTTPHPTSLLCSARLCSAAFAIGYSGQMKESLWSAEHLTEEAVEQARTLQGRSGFYEDTRIPVSDRAELYDYKRSGWSRGHLSPSGDTPTRETRAETFALSNIVPQAASLNSGA